MIFRIPNWFKRKENRKKRKRATVLLGHGLWPSPQCSQPNMDRIQGPPQQAQAKKRNNKKRILASGSLNLFLKPFKPFHYFFVSDIFAFETPLFLSNSSFNPFSFFCTERDFENKRGLPDIKNRIRIEIRAGRKNYGRNFDLLLLGIELLLY
jgi:hypothetical protein